MKKVKNSLFFWIIPPVVAWLVIYGIVAQSFPWNSDYTSIILVVSELFKGKIHMSPDTFLIKYPIILLLNNLVEYGRKYMWFLQMANGAVMVAGFGWYFADFAKRFVDKKISGWIVMVGLFYMATMSFTFYGFTVHPFLRNAEMALMFLFLMVFRKSRGWSMPLLIIMLINDAYFTFVFVIPLLICEIIVDSVKKKDLSINKRFWWLLAGTMFAYILRDRIINKTPYFMIQEELAEFQGWEGIQTSSSLIQQSLINLVGGDFFNLRFYSLRAWTALFAGGLALLAIAGIIKLFVDGIKKQETEMIMPLVSTVITLIISLVSTKIQGLDSGRFLIIICFWLPFGILYFLWEIREFKRLFWVAILGIGMVSVMKAGVIVKKNQENDFWRDNFYHLELTNFLKKNDLEYGYAGFWSSGITTFLAKEEIKIRQVSCNEENIRPQTWVMSDRWYKGENYRGKSFILLDSFRDDEGYLRGCNEKTLLAQFGKPEKVLEFEGDMIFVYENNVAERF